MIASTFWPLRKVCWTAKWSGGQDLRQQIFEQQLAEAAAQLRRLQDLLQRRDVLADLVDLAVRLLQRPEAAVHRADDLRGVVEALTEGALRLLRHLDILPQALVHRGDDAVPAADSRFACWCPGRARTGRAALQFVAAAEAASGRRRAPR